MYCDIAEGKLTNDGNNVAAYSSRYPCQQKRESNALHLFCRIAILPFPACGNPRQEFALGKLTNDGNNVAAYSSRYPCQQKKREHLLSLFLLAGETRFEHATYGFGDRYSTVEPLPYQACSFYNNSKRKSRIFNCFLNFKQKIYR